MHNRTNVGPGACARVAAVALSLVVVAVGLVAARPVSAAASDPCADMSNAPNSARPADLVERYGLSAMHAAGYDGRGMTAAVLQFGMSADVGRLHEFQRCVGVRETPTTQLVFDHGMYIPVVDGDPLLPPAGGEAQSDVEVLPSTAPGIDRLYVIVSPLSTGDPQFYAALIAMLDGLRTGIATDGRRVDVVSFSYGTCEARLSTDPNASWRGLDPALKALADTGTWFFKGAGDAGSSDCSPFPACAADNTFESQPSVHFASSSPWVTSVGGLQYAGTGGRLADPAAVWNTRTSSPHRTDNCSGGGGGESTVFRRPAYQDTVPGGAVPIMRGVPDIAGLAGGGGYLTLKPPTGTIATWHWTGTGGDSLAGPMYAGAFASLRTALVARGLTVPTHVNPVLYALANEPTTYASVFADVTRGDNVLYPDDPRVAGRYPATTGYDLASGLGEVHLGRLLAALTPTPQPEPPRPATPNFTG